MTRLFRVSRGRRRCQPHVDDARVVRESQLVGFQMKLCATFRQSALERSEPLRFGSTSRQRPGTGHAVQPIPYHRNQYHRVVAMGGNIVTRNVRDELLVSVALPIEDQAVLLLVHTCSKVLCPKEDAQFEGHVEPRQAGIGIGLRAGYIVNAISAAFDQAQDFADPHLTRIIDLQRAARNEPTV